MVFLTNNPKNSGNQAPGSAMLYSSTDEYCVQMLYFGIFNRYCINPATKLRVPVA